MPDLESLIDWSKVMPGASTAIPLNLEGSYPVPEDTLEQFTFENEDGEEVVNTRSLGRLVRSFSGGKCAVKTIEGVPTVVSIELNPHLKSVKKKKRGSRR